MPHYFYVKIKAFPTKLKHLFKSNISLALCGLGVFAVILTGSYFQQLLESVLFPSRPTIMQTAAKGGLYLFPNFLEVIFSINNIALIFIGIVSVIPLKKKRLAIEQLILCIAILTALLMLNDIFFSSSVSSFTSYVITNFLFNSVGSSAIFVLFFFILGFINQNFGNNNDVVIDRRAAMFIIGAAILLSASSFMTARFFLRPLDVDFKAVLSGNQTLNFEKMSDDERVSYNVADKDIDPDFRGVLDGMAIKGGLALDGYDQLVELSSSRPFQVSVYTEKRCDPKSSRDLIFSKPYKNLALSLGEYGSRFHITRKDGLALSLEQQQIGQETIEIKSGKVAVTSSITGPGSTTISGNLKIHINAAIFQRNISSDSRSLTINGSMPSSILKLPNITDNLEISNYCSNNIKIPKLFKYDTAYVEVENLAEGSLLKIKAPGGLIRRKDIPLADIEGKRLGISSFLAINATKMSGMLGADKFSTGDTPTAIWLKGLINLRWNDSGGITAEGTSDAAWFNGKMGSQTKWESLGDEWQRWAIGGTIAALIFAARLVLKVFWSIRLKRVVMQ